MVGGGIGGGVGGSLASNKTSGLCSSKLLASLKQNPYPIYLSEQALLFKIIIIKKKRYLRLT